MGVVCERGRGVLGLDLGVLQRKGLEAVLAGAQQPRDARLQVVRGSRTKLRRARLPQRAPRRAGGVAPVGDQIAWNGYLAGAAREGRRSGGGPRRARRRTRRPGSGLSAERAGGANRLSGLRLPGGRLVQLLAGLRVRQRGGPLYPDRAKSALRGGRLPLRRQGL